MNTPLSRLRGSVTKIHKLGVFNVLSVSGKTFTVNCKDCYPRVNDVIQAYGELLSDGTLAVSQPPLVTPGTDRGSIIKFLTNTLRSEKFYDRHAGVLYNLLEQISGYRSLSVADLLSDYTTRWYKTKDMNILTPLELEPEQGKMLVKSWRMGYDVRRLSLLGLTDEMIFNTKMAPPEMYKKLMINPHSVPELPVQTCMQVCMRTEKILSQDQLYCAQISRAVQENQDRRKWCCTHMGWLVKRFNKVRDHIDMLRDEFHLRFCTIPYGEKELELVYTVHSYEDEIRVCNYLIARSKLPGSLYNGVPTGPINTWEYVKDIKSNLDEYQQRAVSMVSKGGATIITGGAGRGKTTVIKELVRLLTLNSVPYALTSFTGAAVTRIKEVLPECEAKTMNMMIASPHGISFKHLIIDESSMVTTSLFGEFLSVFGTNFSCTFIGDNGQLSPIGYGSMFNEMLLSRSIPKVKLMICHRSYLIDGETDGILLNCDRIANWSRGKNYNIMETKNFTVKNGNQTKMMEMVQSFKKHGLESKQLAIISPYKDLDKINRICQLIWCGENEFTIYNDPEGREYYFHIGDRIMMQNNNYEINLMNGTIGVVTTVEKDAIKAVFDGKEVTIPFESEKKKDKYGKIIRKKRDSPGQDDASDLSIKSIKLCYAITVHKSQGSEFDFVIFLAPERDKVNFGFYNNNLVYTGLSRARRAVYIVADIMKLCEAVGHGLPYRCEHLNERLSGELELLYAEEEPEKLDVFEVNPEEYPPDFDDF